MFIKINELHLMKAEAKPFGVPVKRSALIPLVEASELNFAALLDCYSTPEKRFTGWAGKYLEQGYTALVALPPEKWKRDDAEATENDIWVTQKNYLCLRFFFLYISLKKTHLLKNRIKHIDEISYAKLSRTLVPVPALSIQQKLEPTLVNAVMELDHFIRNGEKDLSALHQEYTGAFDNAFGLLHRLNALEAGEPLPGKLVKLKDAGFVQAGKTPNSSIKSYFGTEYPFFNQQAFEQGINIAHATRYLSERGKREARIFPKDSVLVCFIGAQFGKAGLARIPGACNAQMISIAPHENLLPEYLYYQLISPGFQAQMRRAASDYAISKNDFENLYIEVPTLARQQKIIGNLSGLLPVETRDVLLDKAAKLETKLLEHIGAQLAVMERKALHAEA